MSPQTEEFSLCGARLLVFLVLIAVTAGITLANLSSEPVTIDLVAPVYAGKLVERAYGWPLAWYWRNMEQIREQALAGRLVSRVRLEWPVSRYSASSLVVNLATWTAILIVSAVTCHWMMRRYQPARRWRLRVTTLIVLLIVAVPMVLANLSFEASPRGRASFGWPFVWYWHERLVATGWALVHGWDYSAARLAGNLVVWLSIAVAVGLASEWILRRYQPRLRWSLRTLLIGMGLAAALCAWCAALRKRAQEQDAVIAWLKADHVYVERWGPKWLDVVGADPFRRRIVGAQLFIEEEQDEDHFKRVARLPHLRYLAIEAVGFTPSMATALGKMRQLQMLRIDCFDDDDDTQNAAHECLAAVGKLTELRRLSLARMQLHGEHLACLRDLPNLTSLTLTLHDGIDEDAERDCLTEVAKLTQLERLYLTGWNIRRYNLPYLGGLTNLKSLTLESIADDYHKIWIRSAEKAGVLAYLPMLPQLEALDLGGVRVRDVDLCQLAEFPRLKSLCLCQTLVSGAGLRELASLHSLEELAIDDETAVAGLQSLTALARLRAVHLSQYPSSNMARSAKLELDHGDELWVSPRRIDALRSGLEALRRAHPGIVVEADFDDFLEDEFHGTGEIEPPWHEEQRADRGSAYSFEQRSMEEP